MVRLLTVLAFILVAVVPRVQAQTWEQLGLDALQIGWENSGDVVYAKGERVYVGTTTGLYRSNDGGYSWEKVTVAADLTGNIVSAIAIGSDDIKTLYVSIGTRGGEQRRSNLYKTTDGGDTWQTVLDSTIVSMTTIADVKVSPLNRNLVVAVHRAPGPGAGNLDQVFRSTDGGLTWKSNSFSTSSHGVLISIGVSPTEASMIYATGDTQFDVTFYKSTNAGATWLAASLPALTANRIYSDVRNGNFIYVIDAGTRVHFSSDGGDTWSTDASLRDAPWPNRILYKLTQSFQNQNLFLGVTDDGLWAKEFPSGNWSQVVGLPSQPYYEIFVDSTTGYAYVGGQGGLFRTSTIITDVLEPANDLPKIFQLYHNYPNPFNSQTSIEFEIPQKVDIRLEVVNSLGQEVAVLLEGQLDRGRHKAIFNATGLSTGVYFYRLQSPTLTITKPMLLIK